MLPKSLWVGADYLRTLPDRLVYEKEGSSTVPDESTGLSTFDIVPETSKDLPSPIPRFKGIARVLKVFLSFYFNDIYVFSITSLPSPILPSSPFWFIYRVIFIKSANVKRENTNCCTSLNNSQLRTFFTTELLTFLRSRIYYFYGRPKEVESWSKPLIYSSNPNIWDDSRFSVLILLPLCVSNFVPTGRLEDRLCPCETRPRHVVPPVVGAPSTRGLCVGHGDSLTWNVK